MNTELISNISKTALDHDKFNMGRWINVDEGAILHALIKLYKPENVFESGTANGYSSLWIASALGDGVKVHSFDPVNRPKVWDEPHFEVPTDTTDRIVCHKEGFETGVVPLLKNCMGSKLFFIDGDHSQTGLSKDLTAVEKFLKKGDVLVLHDAGLRAIAKVCVRFLDRLSFPNGEKPTSIDFNTRRGIKALLMNGDNHREQIRNLDILDWKTEKVRDIEDWARHDKPYTVYPEKGLHSSSEKHLLYTLGKELGAGNYANLGTWGGCSIACLAFGIRDSGQKGTIYAIDTFSINKVREMPLTIPRHFENLGLNDAVELKICKGTTSEWGDRLKDVKFKFVFIDADHSYEACRDDFDKWSPLVEVGGILGFHDCEYEEVDRVIDESVVQPEWRFIRQIWKTKLFRRVQ